MLTRNDRRSHEALSTLKFETFDVGVAGCLAALDTEIGFAALVKAVVG
jgi:hypothetical protein